MISIKSCLRRNSIINSINAVRHGLINDFNHTVELIDELLPYILIPQNNTQSKKALFGFLGSLAHDLFGVSTDDQLQQGTNYMNVLKIAMSTRWRNDAK